MKYFKLLACLSAFILIMGCTDTDGDADQGAENVVSMGPNDGGIPLSGAGDKAMMQYQKVRRLADNGDFIAANQAARELTENHPDLVASWIMLSNTSLTGPQFVQAATHASQMSADGTEGEQLWAAINMSAISNDTEEGLRLGRQLVDTYPEAPRAWLVYGGLLTGQNQHGEARAAGETVIELAPEQTIGHNNLGFSYLYNEPKNFDVAEQHFMSAAELDPEEDSIRVNIGDVHRAMGDLQAARDDYSQAMMLDPSNSVAAIKRGHVNSFLGNYDEARADYDNGIASGQEGNKSTLANYRAFVSIHSGDYASAVGELKGELERIDTLDMPMDQKVGARNFVLTNLTDICFNYAMLDDAATAVEQLEATLAEAGANSGDPDFARQQEITAAFWKGKLAARQGDYDEAKEQAEEFASLAAADTNPRKLERYHELLALIALQQGDNDSAIAHYRKANLSTSPGTGDVKNIYMLATALEGAGQTDEASALRAEVANWNFNSAWFAMLRNEAASES